MNHSAGDEPAAQQSHARQMLGARPTRPLGPRAATISAIILRAARCWRDPRADVTTPQPLE
ncbi:MAG: hypothetical protein IPO66_02580 [Rhodanobacteraceae bacterium]|nr:hypothetical protein [Rhodanobacteraceae bacterium]